MKPQDLPAWRDRMTPEGNWIRTLPLFFLEEEALSMAFEMHEAQLRMAPEKGPVSDTIPYGMIACPSLGVWVIKDRETRLGDTDSLNLADRIAVVMLEMKEFPSAEDPLKMRAAIDGTGHFREMEFGSDEQDALLEQIYGGLLCLLNEQQELIVTESITAPAHSGESKQAKKRRKRNAVTVINLAQKHRHVGKVLAAGKSHYEHRWIVRGHWRDQPFGPGRKETRRVWIAPYIKGPENAPMLKSEKVYTWEKK